jgi:hypothetical protein
VKISDKVRAALVYADPSSTTAERAASVPVLMPEVAPIAPDEVVSLHAVERAALLALASHVHDLHQEIDGMRGEWKDTPDQWTKECEDAVPYGVTVVDHERYLVALQMVSNRNGKYELVDLANWLLKRAETAEAKLAAQKP